MKLPHIMISGLLLYVVWLCFQVKQNTDLTPSVQTVDGCEYVVFRSGGLCTAVHKPTCNNPLHRLKAWREQ